jgi:hypothetical protein
MEIGDIRKSTDGTLLKISEKLDDGSLIFYVIINKYKIFLKASEEKIKQNSRKVRKKSK